MGDRQVRPSTVNLCPIVGARGPYSVTDHLYSRHLLTRRKMNQTKVKLTITSCLIGSGVARVCLPTLGTSGDSKAELTGAQLRHL